jgi:hypothetical protein
MTRKAIDVRSVCCRRSTAIGDQKAKTCVGTAMAGCKFSVLAAVSPVARTWPAPLVRVSLCARGALVGARALALAFTLCFLTGSDLCTSGLALEAAFGSFRLVRLDPERLVDGFLC